MSLNLFDVAFLGSLTPAVPTDSYFANVSLLLHGDGANGSTTIIDSSPSPKTVTAFGNARISTAQSKFGGASIAFDGTGDYLISPANSSFLFGTGDFTIELWLRLNSFTAFAGICSVWSGDAATSSWLLSQGDNFPGATPGARLRFGTFNQQNGLTVFHQSTGNAYILNQWQHVAIARASGTLKGFIDGSQVISVIETANMNNSNNLSVASISTGGFTSNCYVDDLRITKGIARYTDSFTPPTAPFLDI